MKKIVYNIFLLTLLAVCVSCSQTVLKADNYWNGIEKELAWVKKNQVASVATNQTNSSAQAKSIIPAPHLKNGKTKILIGVVISGEYWEFYDGLEGLIEGFANIGWAKQVKLPRMLSSCGQLIEWLATQQYSDYVEFVPEYFCNLEWGDNSNSIAATYLEKTPGVDVVVVYGGLAANMFYANETYPIPVIADAITDPIAAGITLTEDDSGKDFFSCKIDSSQFRKQIKLFYEITGFKKLGIVYGDTDVGIVYGAVRSVEESAKELGFEIVRNTNVKEEMAEDTLDLYLAALKDVASRSDAVYIGASTAVTEYDSLKQIVQILDEAKVPSFALEGSIRVKDGIMLSLSSSGTVRSGIEIATKIARVVSGEIPRQLSQHFESIPAVAINLATAKKIGFNIPAGIVINSDEVYLSRDGSGPVEINKNKKNEAGLASFMSNTLMTGETFEPQRRPDGKPFRIAVLYSGSYWEFDQHFRGLLEGFSLLGWINEDVLNLRDDMTIADWIKNAKHYSDFLEFVPEYCIDLGWGENLQAADQFFSEEKPDINLIVAFGGVAGKLFTPYKNYSIPVLMEAINDPIGSGIIYSVEDSGRDFITCRVDPGQYQRQLQLFHDIIGFKNLGIIYGDDEYGLLYGAVHDVELVAWRRGFNIVRNTNVKEKIDTDTKELYLEAVRSLCKKVDAIYLGASTALTEYDIAQEVAQILIDEKIPSFALEGEIRVKSGIMLGVSSLEAEKFGLYNAKKITSIFSGTTPRSLVQKMEGLPSIAINMRTARKIHMDISLPVLSTVDKIFY